MACDGTLWWHPVKRHIPSTPKYGSPPPPRAAAAAVAAAAEMVAW